MEPPWKRTRRLWARLGFDKEMGGGQLKISDRGTQMDKIDYDENVELHGNADTNPQIEFSQTSDVVLLDTPRMVDAVRTIMKEWVPVRQAGAMIRRFDGETYDIEDIEKIYQRADFPSN
jgi:hypothetical protein